MRYVELSVLTFVYKFEKLLFLSNISVVIREGTYLLGIDCLNFERRWTMCAYSKHLNHI